MTSRFAPAQGKENPHKRLAGEKAAELVRDGMVVGLGTGSTVYYAIRKLGERVKKEGLDILGIPTSRDTGNYAQELGIPLTTPEEHPEIDLTIDGADEVDPELNLIKGLGGALLMEKIVASISRLLIIVVGFGQLLKAVTAFTVAHSITLALATLGFIHVPSAPTEAIIALSIVFLAGKSFTSATVLSV